MGRVIKMGDTQQPERFDFRKASPKKSSKRQRMEDMGQLDIFGEAPGGKVVSLHGHSNNSPFDQAINYEDTDLALAEEWYWKAIKQHDHVADAYCNLGILYSRKGNQVKAIDHLTQALKYDSRHFEAHYNLGNVYSDHANLPLAQMHYALAIEIMPDFSGTYYNLAIVQALQRDFKGALLNLGKYRQLAEECEKEDANALLENIKRYLTLE